MWDWRRNMSVASFTAATVASCQVAEVKRWTRLATYPAGLWGALRFVHRVHGTNPSRCGLARRTPATAAGRSVGTVCSPSSRRFKRAYAALMYAAGVGAHRHRARFGITVNVTATPRRESARPSTTPEWGDEGSLGVEPHRNVHWSAVRRLGRAGPRAAAVGHSPSCQPSRLEPPPHRFAVGGQVFGLRQRDDYPTVSFIAASSYRRHGCP